MEKTFPRKVVNVVVLGDIGRSPRMQYHALSLVNSGFKVNIISYVETQPLEEILINSNITINKLHPIVFNKGPRLVQYITKALWQTVSLFLALLICGRCDYLLCQNPPAIPSLPVCRFYCLITRAKFVIDWHNYAYSIMAMSLPHNNILLNISTYIEKSFGQSATNNFCVSYAMKEDLLHKWGIEATVLYDRPPKIFHPVTLLEKHEFLLRMSKDLPELGCSGREYLNHPVADTVSKTVFTQMIGNNVELRSDRPGFLFSSTSWTPDENFSVLLEALQVYEITHSLTKTLPRLVCVITGKGPMKQYYMDEIALRNWRNIKVITPWLEARDYPVMVASADLGVSLHTSSSGLDLPMKIVDMFGAGLPVLAYNFKCLHELVQDGINGYTFSSSDELAKLLVTWFESFPVNEKQNEIHDRIRDQLLEFQKSKWEDNWNLRAKKIFNFNS